MHLGIRLLFGFFLITGLAGFFVLRIFMAEVKPSVREVMEDMMVDTANILAELASDDLAKLNQLPQLPNQPAPTLDGGRFATHVNNYARRPIDAKIWGLAKQSLDFRVYVTDATGKVVFDSTHGALGRDYSQWRDVALTLRGQYGARSTRDIQHDERSSVMYVGAPVLHNGEVIGVLTVAKPTATVQAFIDRAERKIFISGLWLLALSAAVGVIVTLWVVWRIRQLRQYANQVEAGKKVPAPHMPGELGELARAMEAMRLRVEGREYIEAYVRALTHELKSPLAAIRGAGELLQEPLPEADRQAFAADVLDQTQRLQTMVDQLLELSKLEQLQAPQAPQSVVLADFCKRFVPPAQAARRQIAIETVANAPFATVQADPGLLGLALSNLLENAAAFSPAGSTVRVEVQGTVVSVTDSGPGAPDFALPHLGEKFFSTVRPDGVTKGSGLGLAIVRQIMALHGGRMVVRNTDLGLRVELHFA